MPFSGFVRDWAAGRANPQKSVFLPHRPPATIERDPRRFRNTRGRRRGPTGARTAADGVRAGAGARRAQIPGEGTVVNLRDIRGFLLSAYAPTYATHLRVGTFRVIRRRCPLAYAYALIL